MNNEQAYQITWVLANAFPNAKISENTVDLYVDFIEPYDYQLTKQAVLCLIKTCTFFPTIAEITSAVEKFNSNRLPETDQAWDEVMCQLSEVGHCGIPQFTNEDIKMAVKTIGWMNLCCSTAIGVERAHFFKVYDAIRNRHQDREINNQVLQLVGGIGLLEAKNE